MYRARDAWQVCSLDGVNMRGRLVPMIELLWYRPWRHDGAETRQQGWPMVRLLTAPTVALTTASHFSSGCRLGPESSRYN